MIEENLPIKVAALYRFCRLENYQELRAPLLGMCKHEGIKGTILLAREGINGTVAGTPHAIDTLVEWLDKRGFLDGMEIKFSGAQEMPFFRLKVRLKKEIVTMGVPDIDPLDDVGTYLNPREWNDLVVKDDTIIIDTRNDYETAIGTFEGAIDPHTKTFREFPQWVEDNRAQLEGKKIAMFCTGGIRCEKATAYVRSLGHDDVYHLKGGILKYLEEVRVEDSLWKGECFVFDERVAVGHGLEQGETKICRACRHPLSPEDLRSPDFKAGISCHYCIDSKTAEERARYIEREKQMRLARKKGIKHLGD